MCMYVFRKHILKLLQCLFSSHFLYPSKRWKSGDDISASSDGKYELLSVTNDLFAEEIRNLMDKSKSFNDLIFVIPTKGVVHPKMRIC